MTTKFICEVGSNHNQSHVRCAEFIEEAARLGCWGIKFQLFDAKQLWTKEKTIKKMSKWQLPVDFVPGLYALCRSYDIKLGFSVFHPDTVPLVKDHCDFLKIGSYEIRCLDLIKVCIKTKKQVFISLGLARPYDIPHDILNAYGNNNEIFLNCNSNYPAKVNECGMERFSYLERSSYPLIRGWSDHTVEPGVIYSAVGYGAEWIEFHMDLPTNEVGNERRSGHCWFPIEIKNVIKTVRVMEESRTGSSNIEELEKLMTDPKTYKRNY